MEQGGRYIESTEDHLRRTGHWLETEPQEEEMDPSVTQLDADFADFEEPGAGAWGQRQHLELTSVLIAYIPSWSTIPPVT